ncbi:uncharacterized protein LOC118794646 [Megalops cyprinoides]|uniref:uncharacterized protein LOC118794646 n=1 Tax=Megalops cyprinoides TaxID=118141 RepID=UPI001863A4F5|nr:uncharacterized protein LOC118794646 [Megalops cyprinoides]
MVKMLVLSVQGSYSCRYRIPGSQPVSSPRSNSIDIIIVDFVHHGAYRCQYKTRVSDRPFSSPHSDSVSFSVIVVLLQPNISLSDPAGGMIWAHQEPEVVRGSSFTITCSTPPQYPGGFLHLTFTGSSKTDTQAALNHSASFLFPAAEFSHQGNYSCVYETTVSTRNFSSPQSELLPVMVRVSLPKPSISVSAREVTWGRSVDITCSITPVHSGGTFVLQKVSGSYRDTKSSSSNSATFTITAVNFIHEGAYRLVLQQPNISFSDTAGGMIWGHQGPEVVRGSSFTITCSTPPQYPGGFFHLMFTGSNRTEIQAAVNHSASFLFPAAEFSHQGNYSCVYETTVSTRNFSSPQSELLPLMVRGLLDPSGTFI